MHKTSSLCIVLRKKRLNRLTAWVRAGTGFGPDAGALGWCWDDNPHTWLGSASCGRRLGPEPLR